MNLFYLKPQNTNYATNTTSDKNNEYCKYS